eukprot:CAMPEP_0180420182 /NCGR_PEP_ID=MMETSP1036_2-20121128/2499_1 /TAXON_ID=632150 /ORGANISM="Azadinium spinosum, Strain 3D9" /LENGTH=236 /DNA_ID=CAMNT_0022425399 /DNA_START=155 /DNA_END=864 /DNA_ORIENTATION=+
MTYPSKLSSPEHRAACAQCLPSMSPTSRRVRIGEDLQAHQAAGSGDDTIGSSTSRLWQSEASRCHVDGLQKRQAQVSHPGPNFLWGRHFGFHQSTIACQGPQLAPWSLEFVAHFRFLELDDYDENGFVPLQSLYLTGDERITITYALHFEKQINTTFSCENEVPMQRMHGKLVWDCLVCSGQGLSHHLPPINSTPRSAAKCILTASEDITFCNLLEVQSSSNEDGWRLLPDMSQNA